MKKQWHLWVWDGVWMIASTHASADSCKSAGKQTADPHDTWAVAVVGSQKDDHIREHATERDAPYS